MAHKWHFMTLKNGTFGDKTNNTAVIVTFQNTKRHRKHQLRENYVNFVLIHFLNGPQMELHFVIEGLSHQYM